MLLFSTHKFHIFIPVFIGSQYIVMQNTCGICTDRFLSRDMHIFITPINHRSIVQTESIIKEMFQFFLAGV